MLEKDGRNYIAGYSNNDELSFTFAAGESEGIQSFVGSYEGSTKGYAGLLLRERQGYFRQEQSAVLVDVITPEPAAIVYLAKWKHSFTEGDPFAVEVWAVTARNVPALRGDMRVKVVTEGDEATSDDQDSEDATQYTRPDYRSMLEGLTIKGTPGQDTFEYNDDAHEDDLFVGTATTPAEDGEGDPYVFHDDDLIEGDETMRFLLDRGAGLPIHSVRLSPPSPSGAYKVDFSSVCNRDDNPCAADVVVHDNEGATVRFDTEAVSMVEGESVELRLDTYPRGLDRQHPIAVTLTVDDPDNALGANVIEFTQVLPGQPTADLDDMGEMVVDESSDPVTITVTPEDNMTVEGGPRTVTITVTAIPASGTGEDRVAGSRGIPIGDIDTVTVVIDDNDTPAILVERDALTVAQGGSEPLRVRLSSAPSAEITVAIDGETEDVETHPDVLSFSGIDFATWKTVDVSAPVDRDADDEEVTLILSSKGYDAMAVSVTVTVDDPDTAGVIADPTELTVDEGGGTAAYTLVLTSPPSDDVTVTVQVPADAQFDAEPKSLTFTDVNYNVEQAVTVTSDDPGDDNAAEEPPVSIAHSASGGGYDGAGADSVAVTVRESSTPALGAAPERLTVGEGADRSGTFAVRLSHEPSDTVTVTVTGQSGAVSVDEDTLTFEASDWAARTVTVTLAADDDAVVPEPVTLTLTAGGAGEYDGQTKTVAVTFAESESVGLVLEPGSLEVEEGAAETYTVALASKPVATVTVAVTGHSGTDLTVTADPPLPLTFAPEQWAAAQTVTVEAAQDDDYDDEDTITLAHAASSSDDTYDLARDLDVKILDDDRAPATARFVSRPRHGHSYGAAEYIVVGVAFEDDAIVDGEPRLKLAFDDGEERMADYHSGAGTPTLLFDYEVQPMDRDYDRSGVGIPEESLDLNGGSVTVDGQPAGHPAPRPSQGGHKVNVPVWVVTADPLGIAEGESATVTARSVNGAATREETSTNLFVRGGDAADYALSPGVRQVVEAGWTEASWTIEALADDDAPERPEVLELVFTQNGPSGGVFAGELAIREAGEPGPPGRPHNLVAVGRLHDAVLTWSRPETGSEPDGYQWRERYGYQRWTDVPAGELRAVPDVVVYGFTYQFEVRAVRDGAGGPAAGPVFVTIGYEGYVSAPQNLRAFPGNREVQLIWEPPAERVASGYEVEVDLNREWIPIGDVETYRAGGLTNGVPVPLRVRAIESGLPGPAASVTATPGGANAAASGPLVGPPRLVSATARGTRVELRYDRPLDMNARPVAADFLVVADGEPRELAAVRVAGALVVLELAAPVAARARVAASYPAPGAHPVRDPEGRLAGPSYRAPVRVLAPVEVEGTAPRGEETSPEPLSELPPATPLAAPGAPLSPALELADLAAFRPDAPWRRRADLAGVADPRLAAAFAEALGAAPDGAVADLGVLRADRRGIVTLDGIGRAAELSELDLSGNAVSDLAPLARLSELRRLHLAGNAAYSLGPLAGLSKLKRLDLAANRVADLGPLANLVNLETLLLADNAVSDLTPMVHLASLVRLDLSGNPVTDLAALADLRALRRLDLPGARVADVSPLGDVGSLVWLDLSGNALVDPSPIGRLVLLRWLFADDPAALAWLVEPGRRPRLEVHPRTPAHALDASRE